jgi:hypothetical protein
MKTGLDVMKAALRVLSSITEKQAPDSRDLQALRAYAPEAAGFADDELAREMIQRALRARASLRGEARAQVWRSMRR